MSEGKFIEQLEREFAALDDNDIAKEQPHVVLVRLANKVAADHPLWYEGFYLRAKFGGAWRWVISRTWFDRSKRRGDSSASGDGGGGCGNG